jgi:glycosyltransferase involved in cell wall biosynthesis
VTQPVLAAHMRKANALIIYSRYETFGCVVIEANACGLPVIASNIPVMHELIKEGENGFFVRGEDPEALAVALRSFSESPAIFDANRIAKDADARYSYESVGKIIGDWYKQ